MRQVVPKITARLIRSEVGSSVWMGGSLFENKGRFSELRKWDVWSLSKNYHPHIKLSFSRPVLRSLVLRSVLLRVATTKDERREFSVFNTFWIPRSSPSRISARSRIDRRMTNTEFLDKLCVPNYPNYQLCIYGIPEWC